MNNEELPREEKVESIYEDSDNGDKHIKKPEIAEEIAYAEKDLGRDAALALEHRLEGEASGERVLTEKEKEYVELINKITSKPDIDGVPNPYFEEGFMGRVMDEDGYPALVIPDTYGKGCNTDEILVITRKGVFEGEFIYRKDNWNYTSTGAYFPLVNTDELVKLILSSDIKEGTDEKGNDYHTFLPLNTDILKIDERPVLDGFHSPNALELEKLDYDYFKNRILPSKLSEKIKYYEASMEYEKNRELKEKNNSNKSLSDTVYLGSN